MLSMLFLCMVSNAGSVDGVNGVKAILRVEMRIPMYQKHQLAFQCCIPKSGDRGRFFRGELMDELQQHYTRLYDWCWTSKYTTRLLSPYINK